MNQQNDKIRIESEPFRQFTSALYQGAGVPKADADAVSGRCRLIPMREVCFHTGLARFPAMYAVFLTAKSIQRRHRRFWTDAPSTALIDADNSLGHVAGIYAMNMAIEKADTTGFASVAVRNSNHYGAAACFAMMALPKGMIGFKHHQKRVGQVLCRTVGCRDCSATTPVGYAIPTKEELPIVLDMAVGQIAWGPCRNVCDGRETVTTRLCIGRGGQADTRSTSSERDAALWRV